MARSILSIYSTYRYYCLAYAKYHVTTSLYFAEEGMQFVIQNYLCNEGLKVFFFPPTNVHSESVGMKKIRNPWARYR